MRGRLFAVLDGLWRHHLVFFMFTLWTASLTVCAGLLYADPASVPTEDGRGLWLVDSQGLFENLIGRWLDDGSDGGQLERYGAPFSPFSYRGPAGSIQDVRVLTLHGVQGVLVGGRAFYEEQGASWTHRDLVMAPGNPLGCAVISKQSTCRIMYSGNDGRGGQLFAIDDSPGQRHYVVEDANGSFHPAVGPFAQLTDLEIEILQFYKLGYLWSKDGESVVSPSLFNFANSKPDLHYDVLSAAGRRTVTVVLPGHKGESYQIGELLQVGDKTYAVAAFDKPGPQQEGRVSLAVYEVSDLFGLAPQVTLLQELLGAMPLYNTQLDGSIFYYSSQSAAGISLAAFDLSKNTTTKLADVGDCTFNYLTKSGGAGANQRPASLWFACGSQAFEFAGGKLLRTYQAPAPVVSASVRTLPGQGEEAVLGLGSGDLIRLAQDGSSHIIRIKSEGAPLSVPLYPVWEEDSRVCGVPQAAEANLNGDRVVLCQRGRTLAAGISTLPAPLPLEVAHTTTGLWALSADDKYVYIYQRAEGRPGSAWEQVQFWPRPPNGKTPRLLPQGLDRVAVDLGTDELWTLAPSAGKAFSRGYPHPRPPANMRPVLSADGYLYEDCANKPAALCAVAASGTETPLDVPYFRGDSQLFALKRGVLLMASELYTLRDTRGIKLSSLYGELAHSGDNFFDYVLRDAGAGRVHIVGYQGTKSYRFDGEHLEVLPPPPAAFNFFEAENSVRSASASPARPPQQSWQGEDGLWRTITPKTSGFFYSMDPVTAAFGTPNLHPNRVAGTVRRDGLLWLATESGLWTCDEAKAPPLKRDMVAFELTPGCMLRLALPYLGALVDTPAGLVVTQGQQLLLVVPGADASGGDDQIEAVYRGDLQAFGSSRPRGNQDAAVLSWVAGEQLFELNTAALTAAPASPESALLPAQISAKEVRATAPGWLCTATGVYRRRGDAWEQSPEVTDCVGITVHAEAALILGEGQAWSCTEAACQALSLPAPALTDSVVGSFAGGAFGLVLGNRLFRLEGAGFTDITPVFSGGSALLTRAASLQDGVLSLRGGGVLVGTAAAPSWRYLRLD